MLKKYILLLISFLTIFTAIAPLSVNADTQSEKRVYDDAYLFTEAQTKTLEKRIASIRAYGKMDVVIVTTRSTGFKSDMEYADDFYDDPQYNFGFGQYKSGVLLLINLANTGSVYISTCGDGIFYMSDDRVEATLDYLWSSFSDYDNFNTAYKFLDKAEIYSYDTVDSFYDPEFPDGYDGKRIGYFSRLFRFDPVFAFIAFIITFMLVVSFIFGTKEKYGKIKDSVSVKDYLSDTALQILSGEDTFISSDISRVKVSSNTHHGSGGRRSRTGGSHRSSSGRLHGGGGRRR